MAVATALLLAASANSASAQVQNGSFESSGPAPYGGFNTYSAGQNFGNWTVSFGSIDLINGYWQAANGTYSIDMDGYSPGGIFQDLVTSAGARYDLTFAMSGNFAGGSTVKTMNVFWDNALAGTFTFDVTGINGGNMNWTSHGLNSLLASGSTTRLEFQSANNGSGGCCYGPALDDVGLVLATTATPEPASIALLATGFVAIAGGAHRRRRGTIVNG